MEQNRISDVLPSSIGNIGGKLIEILLSSNDLAGSVPAEFGRLRNLIELDLSGNDFSGNIPMDLGLLGELRTLDLSQNSLSGEITNLATLKGLKELRLNGNALTGNLHALAQNTLLRQLFLNTNNFNGTIPDFSKLVNLNVLTLEGNALVGTMPPPICALDLRELSADCGTKNGVSCSCCSRCVSGNVHVGNSSSVTSERLSANSVKSSNSSPNVVVTTSAPPISDWTSHSATDDAATDLSEKLINFLSTISIKHLLQDRQTPQGRACEWLARDESYQAYAAFGSGDADHLVYKGTSIKVALWTRYALATFFYATHGDSWYETKNWMSNSSVCGWHGLTCIDHDPSGGRRVKDIQLSSNNLTGSLVSELEVLISTGKSLQMNTRRQLIFAAMIMFMLNKFFFSSVHFFNCAKKLLI